MQTDASGNLTPVTIQRRRNGVAEEAHKFADLAFTVENKDYWIDVSFIDPAGANAIRRGSLATGGRAADLREISKRKEYEAAKGKVWTDSYFVPFVLETTGRLGRAGAKLVHNLVVDGPSHRRFASSDPFKPSSRLYKALVTLCVSSNAVSIRNASHRRRPLATQEGQEIRISQELMEEEDGIHEDPWSSNPLADELLLNDGYPFRETATDTRLAPPLELPFDRAPLRVAFASRCSSSFCRGSNSASGLCDILCECQNIFCLPCDRVHRRLCDMAQRVDESMGPLATRCHVLDCRMSPAAEVFKACPCDQATLFCGSH